MIELPSTAPGRPFRVVIAPDKFKGSLQAVTVAEIVASALIERTSAVESTSRGSRQLEVVQQPIADGGEGTVDVAIACGFTPVTVTVTGPLGEPVQARFARRGSVAVLEMASAAGLGLLPRAPDEATARIATTYGVGELILAAVDQGATRVVLGAGGSATTDGGAGAAEAIGVDVSALVAAHTSNTTFVHRPNPLLRDIELVIACDVDNPLLGPDGAAHAYAAQKGAGPALRDKLEERLTQWSEAVTAATGAEHHSLPGTGAAGGLAYGLVALAGARIVSGVELMLDLTGFAETVSDADVVIVGEGSLDAQSLRGKGPVGIARSLEGGGAVVVAVAGRCTLTADERARVGLRQVYAITDIETDEEKCMADASSLLARISAQLADDWVVPELMYPISPPTAAEYRAAMLGSVGVSESTD